METPTLSNDLTENYWHTFHVFYEKQVRAGKPIFRNEIQESVVLGFSPQPTPGNCDMARFDIEQRAKKAKWTVFKITDCKYISSKKFNFPTGQK